jgi:putative inorganic carbon (HCO3(-)) transporter
MHATNPVGAALLRLLALVLALVPVVVLPGHLDFSRLPQQAFVQAAALVLGLAWLTRGGGDLEQRPRGALDLPLLAFLGWSGLSLLVAADPLAGLRTLGHWLACALAYILVSRLARPEDARRLCGALLLGGAGVALVGLSQGLFDLELVPQAVAPASTLANRNVAAAFVVVVMPLALVPWSTPLARRAAWAAVVLMAAFLPLTRSRAAALGVALQLLLLAALLRKMAGPGPGERRPWIVVPAVVLLALGGAAWLTRVDPMKQRSVDIRADLAASAFSMARERPLLGFGLGGFTQAYPAYGPPVASVLGDPLRVESPHAEPLQVVAETGVPGLLALLWMAVATVRTLRRRLVSPDPNVRRLGLALALALAGFGVDAALGFPLRVGAAPLVLAVLLGMLTAAERTLPLPAEQPRTLARLPGFGPSVAAVALILIAATLADSVRRLSVDGARYRALLFPVAHAQTRPACGPGLTLARHADGRIDLAASNVPLAEVLKCLEAETGLKVEYEGPEPRQPVAVTLEGEPLASALASLLEGLGVNYLLSRDPSGVDRLVLFSAGSRPEPARGTPRPAPAGVPDLEPSAAEETPVPEAQPFGPPGGAPGLPGAGAPGDPGAPFPEPAEGWGERAPYPEEPGELSPMTLQLGRRPGSGVASRTSPGSRGFAGTGGA